MDTFIDSSLQWTAVASILVQLVAPCSVAANLQTIGADRVSTVQGHEQLTLSAPIVCRSAATQQGITKAIHGAHN